MERSDFASLLSIFMGNFRAISAIDKEKPIPTGKYKIKE